MNHRKKTIWIIDDDTAVLEAIEAVLKEEGYTVVTIDDSTTIENRIKTETLPSLIYLDILMSALDGPGVAKILKTTDSTKEIPIIMLSANIQVAAIAKEAHVSAYLKKPFDISELIRLTEKYI